MTAEVVQFEISADPGWLDFPPERPFCDPGVGFDWPGCLDGCHGFARAFVEDETRHAAIQNIRESIDA